MKIPILNTDTIEQLRGFFHPKDRSVVLADNTFIEGEEVATPANPRHNRGRLYWKNSCWTQLDENGNESSLCYGGAGAGTLNPIINGIPLIWQRGTSFAAVANGTYTADRWAYGKSGDMVHTITQDTSVPTVAQAGLLLPYSIKLDVTTVDAAIAAGDFCLIGQRIEGYNWLQLAQRQFTLGFWARDTKTGVHCVSFRNSGNDRSYVAEYTIASADTWEYFTITVSASPSAGTWDYTTGVGLSIFWALAVGSTFQVAAGSWQTGLYFGTSNQVNAVDNTANNFQITGVTVTPGAYARPLALPDIQQEWARCQRYYCKSYQYASAPGAADTTAATGFSTRVAIAATTAGVLRFGDRWPVTMRTTPTVVLYSPNTGTANAVRNASAANDRTGATASGPADSGFANIAIDNTSANAIALDDIITFHFAASAEL